MQKDHLPPLPIQFPNVWQQKNIRYDTGVSVGRNDRSPSYSMQVPQQGVSIDDSDQDPSSEPTVHSHSESR